MTSKFLNYISELGLFTGLKVYTHIKFKKKSGLRVPFLKYPVFFRGISSDKIMFRQIFVDKDYDVPVNSDPKIIVDLGANVGYASLFFANRFPDAKIFAVEPEENNYQAAKKNTAAYKNITVVKGAVWHKSEQINVVDKGFGEAAFMIEQGEGTNTVKAYTIDEIMKLMGVTEIDILKIDIEGTEKEIFETGYENWVPNSKMIIIETHDRYKSGTSKAVFSAVGKYNFSLELSGENLILYNEDLKKDFTKNHQLFSKLH